MLQGDTLEPMTYLRTDENQVYVCLVVGPRPKLHGAVLVVEGEVGDVHGAGGLEDGWWNPGDGAVKLQQGLGLVLHQEIPHSTGREQEVDTCMRS